MQLKLPEVCLVVLVGPSGSGKSTFARQHFAPTEVVSSDFCRALVADDENDQSATNEAFEVLHTIVAKRLARQRLTVIDATNVQSESRKPLLALAREFHVLPVVIVFDLPRNLCHERNATRADRSFGSHVIRQQLSQLRRSLKSLKREGFRNITVLQSPADVEAVTIERTRLWTNLRHEHGPFDIIGDVHGCFGELCTLLDRLGYTVDADPQKPSAQPPPGRKAVFLGDLVDRGPASPAVLRLVMDMVKQETALCVPGNHEQKLLRKLRGKDVRLTHGLAETMAQLEREPPELRDEVARFIDGLISHYVLDDGRLVVAHAGLAEELQGRASGKVRQFALYGETTGETDEFGLPVRYDWAADYRGSAKVVYGHTPVPDAVWVNGTICVDTGCVFGGKLTALRYPEVELCQVDAEKVHYEPVKPLEASRPADARAGDDLLDIDDVYGKRIVETRIRETVTVRAENAAAALEVMSRFAVDPRWLIYLPPTMSPSGTAATEGLLEHPAEAFGYFRSQGVGEVVCEEKHMGSRVVVVLCRDEATARDRFGIDDAGVGTVYTRTGRPFFKDAELEQRLLARVATALEHAGFWREHDTNWVCLDAELMPWSSKAQELLRSQYAAVGSSARLALADAVGALEQAATRHAKASPLLARVRERRDAVSAYVDAYRRYCWPVSELDDLALAPFHVLATEGAVHTDRDHTWHMETAARLAAADPDLLRATRFLRVDVNDAEQVARGTSWWEQLTAGGGEGMVVKPLSWIQHGKRGLVQPALKCRGREYLRIIYGPEYLAPEHLPRLRQRALGRKRSLALREFALGLEALHRFVEREPLYRVHECAFGVLALESEPVDPRL